MVVVLCLFTDVQIQHSLITILLNTDDGSCIPFIYGCIDSTQFNYDPWLNTDDGGCIPFIYGCMDSNYANFNNANTDDGTC